MATATTSNKPDWDSILALYGEGAGDPEIARALKITIGRFYELMEESPAFANFVERGRTLAMAWWYEKGRVGLFADKFNTSLYNFNMKNRFGWADKVDTNDTTNKEPVNLDAAKGQLAAALKMLGKKHPELLSGANLNTSTENADD